MTNKFLITFIFLAGVFIAGFGTQKVQAGCTEYWDCPTGNFCQIVDDPTKTPSKVPGSGTCVPNGTPPQPPPVNNPPPAVGGGSCDGKTHTADCGSCGAPDQGQCGVGDNSDTCNCNPPGNSPCDSNAESNGAGGCRAKSGAPPPPPPAPAPKTNPPNSCTGECHCGNSACGDYMIEDGVNKVCARGVDSGPAWKCDEGVWIVPPAPPPPGPDCGATGYVQTTETKFVGTENNSCRQRKFINGCGDTEWRDDPTDSCIPLSQKSCEGSSVHDCSADSSQSLICTGTKSRTCNYFTGTWNDYSTSCTCIPAKYRWIGNGICVLDTVNGTFDSPEACKEFYAPTKPPVPAPLPVPVVKTTPYCIPPDHLCKAVDSRGVCIPIEGISCYPGVCLDKDNKCTAMSYGVVLNISVSGSIISDAKITLFSEGKKVQEARTDSVGNLSLILDQKAIEENTEFVITVEKQGYKTFKTTWRPGQGVSYFMQIQLEKGDLKDNGGQANINAQGVSYQLDVGWNFVSINLQSEINTAKKLTDEVNRQGGQVIFISRWLGDRWESYVPNAGSADFAVEPGKSYMIKVSKKSEFTLSGNPQKNSSTTVEKGWNAVSFPLLEKQTVTADGKLKALNGSIISRFSSGLWDTYARLGNPIQVYGNDYELDSRQGYFVKVE